ncbi:hypothetical protein ASPZODRAFT_128718 [Penicilliopsis zonata CBS 506.65]|uniref:Rhodopsin domain-containing protein n=1 Tax=Penicilliopsis zonata CBS 506.65 TaxID=1073090 RepID=A0A1L9SSK7_9EURO|nr:hypothetical protein ASPZODRAFT_128718 [Penicilliopsis zonata CBS 506.65]OJJ50113.1 hypothetical protein ASPZODRAFT_128718 [Penicilliopsis zonata CBS 506.65]
MATSSAYDSYNSGTGLLITLWTLSVVSAMFIGLRGLAKWKIGHLSSDDAVMVVALVFFMVGSATATVAVDHGLGHRYTSIPHARAVKAIIFYCVTGTMGILCGTSGRVSFILYVRRLLPRNSIIQHVFWALVAGQIAINVVSIFLMFFECGGNVAAVFDAGLSQTKCMSRWIQIDYGYFQGCFNTACDLFLAVYPTYTFWSLQLKLRVKIALACLLGLGLFAMIASVVKTVLITTIARTSDPTVDQVTLLRWVYIEAAIVIITASIPCLRSLFVVAVANLFNASTKQKAATYGLRSGRYSRHLDEMEMMYDETPAQILQRGGGIMKHVDVVVREDPASAIF